MSLLKVESPIYDDGFTVVAAVAAISQIYFSVQRDDTNGTGYVALDVGGKVEFTWTVYPNNLAPGDKIYIAQDATDTPVPQYKGLHVLDTETAPGQWVTTSDFIDGDVEGFTTFQNNDIYTLAIFLETEINEFTTDTIQYKIPFNSPVFNFNISEAVRPIFSAIQETYFELQATLSAVDSFGTPQGGSAIASYGIQCFASQLKGGSPYGANLLTYVLRTTFPGEILTQFEAPKLFDNQEVLFYYYGDQDFGFAIFNWQYKDVNGTNVGALNQLTFSFGGFGLNTVPQTLTSFPAGATNVDCWISETGVGFPAMTNITNYKLSTVCQHEVTLRWLNELGGIETYNFDIDNEAKFDNIPGIKFVTGGVNNLKDNVYKKRNLWGDNIQSYQISSRGLCRVDLDIVQQILRSPFVYLVTGNTNPALAILRVEVTNGFTIPYQVSQKREHDFICTIELDKNQEFLPDVISTI